MKTTHNPMKQRLQQAGMIFLLTTCLTLQAQTTLFDGHTDLAIDYDQTSDVWNLHAGSDTTGQTYAASNVVLEVKSAALSPVPTNAAFSFLGSNTPLWILPQAQNENILYLGYGGDGIPAGVFVNNQVTVTLQSVTGPGDFFSYKVDGFGTPTVYFNTRDGVSTNDQVTVQAGGDAHLNWAFTKAGTYQVVLQASGTLVNGNQTTTSEPVTYTFKVVTPAILNTGHTDLAIDYDSTGNAWNLHVGSDTFGTEYGASEVFLEVNSAAITTIPTNAGFSFLGSAGTPIWLLPQAQNEKLLYLGYGGDGIPAGVFVNDRVTVTLQNVTGPGDFFSYKVDGFGTPTVYFNSRDGIATNDQVTVQAGGDAHLNWAFTKEGIYQVVLQASGTLLEGGQIVKSGPVTYFFEVLAPTILSTGHTDIALDYDDVTSHWDLHVGSDTFGTEYAANEVILQVDGDAKTNIPSSLSFLGNSGDPVWILPQAQNENLLYLGYGGDGIPDGVFKDNQVTVTLKSVTGPGDFFSYKVDGFGTPTVYFNTRDGIGSADSATVLAGGDAHLNWAFTAAGNYKVVLQTSGTLLNGNTSITSAAVTLTFSVISPQAQLNNEHVDLRIEYTSTASNVLSIIASDENHGIHYATNEAILVVGAASQTTLPDGTPFGNAGDSLWIAPQSQNPDLLYLGISAEGVPLGVFTGKLNFRLVAFDGPGDFFLWQYSGGFDLKINTRDGLDESDETTPIIPSHEHYNWGFTTNGVYHLTFQASGLYNGVTVTSLPATFTFNVLPLPATPSIPPYQAWQNIHWPQGTSAFITGPDADPDGDGIANGLEYALNLNPNATDTAVTPTFSFITNGLNTYGALTFTQVKGDANLVYEPLAKSDLNSSVWDLLTDIVSSVDNGLTETITVRDSIPAALAPTRFYQLRVRFKNP